MTVTNPYYEFDPFFVPNTKARSDAVNIQYQAIQNAFDLLPGDADALTTDTAIFAPESGSGNAYVVTMPDTRTSNQDGDGIRFFATHTNAGAATLDVDSIGPIALVNWAGTVLTGNEIVSGRLYEVRYDATGAQFVLAATTDAALQVTYAEEWAIQPEDIPVSVAAGGDGITEFSAFHWAQKSLAGSVSGRVLTDINTATPPTTEGVTGAHEIWDADQTDLLQRLGFIGSNELVLKNYMHDGNFKLAVETAAGVEVPYKFSDTRFGIPVAVGVTFEDTGLVERESLILEAGSGGDTDFTSVELLADGDGADGATTYTERSLNTFGATFVGNAQLDTAQFKFGTASFLLDGVGDYVHYADDPAFNLGSGIWTIEGWVRFNSFPAVGDEMTLVSQWSTSTSSDEAFAISVIQDGGAIRFRGEVGDAFGTFEQGSLPAGSTNTNQWYHFVMQRSAGDVLSLWFNGLLEFEAAVLSGSVNDSTETVKLGVYDPTDGFSNEGFLDGWLDDVRITIGVERYTTGGSITPPVSAFPTSGPADAFKVGNTAIQTVILGSGDDAAQTISAATGGLQANNTLTGVGMERVLTASDLASGSLTAPVVALADINTATPPTTEAVTGAYEIWDNDETDLLAQIGFASASDDLQIRNFMSGDVHIMVAAGLENAAVFRANDSSSIYHDNIERFRTGPAGKIKIRSDGNTDTEELRHVFEHADGTDRGWLGFNAATTLTLQNEKHSGSVVLAGEDAAGVPRIFFQADPNSIVDITAQTSLRLFIDGGNNAIIATGGAGVDLYNNNIKRFSTGAAGVVTVRSDDNVQTSTRMVAFAFQDGTRQGFIGHETGSVFHIRSESHGQNITMSAEDAGGIVRTIISGDPDGDSFARATRHFTIQTNITEDALVATQNAGVDLYYNAVKVFGTSASGNAAVYSAGNTDTELRRLSFLHNDQTSRGYIGHASTDIFRMENEIHGGNILLSGQDGAGVTRDFFSANPDTNITIAAPETMFLTVNTNDAVKVAIVCASGGDRPVDLYADGSLRLRTQLHTGADNQTGVAITGPDGILTPAGLAGSKDRNISIAGVNRLQNSWQISTLRVTGATSTLQTENATGTAQTDIRAGSIWRVWNMSGSTTTIAAGTSVTLTWLDGAGGATGTRTLADRGECTVQKLDDNDYFIWGTGLT